MGRVGEKTASREVGNFFFPNFFFFKLECIGGIFFFFIGGIFVVEKMKKKFHSALLDPPSRYTGNNFLFKGGLIEKRPFDIPLAGHSIFCRTPGHQA